MKKTLLFPVIAFALAACGSPQAQLPVTDGNFSGSASQFVVTEAELNGQFVKAFEVEKGSGADLIPDVSDTEEPGWQAQFTQPAGAEQDSSLPSYFVSTAYVHGSPAEVSARFTAEGAPRLYEHFADGTLVRLADVPGLDPNQHLVILFPEDGAIQVLVGCRNLMLSFYGESDGDAESLAAFLGDLAKSHIAWIQAHEK